MRLQDLVSRWFSIWSSNCVLVNGKSVFFWCYYVSKSLVGVPSYKAQIEVNTYIIDIWDLGWLHLGWLSKGHSAGLKRTYIISLIYYSYPRSGQSQCRTKKGQYITHILFISGIWADSIGAGSRKAIHMHHSSSPPQPEILTVTYNVHTSQPIDVTFMGP